MGRCRSQNMIRLKKLSVEAAARPGSLLSRRGILVDCRQTRRGLVDGEVTNGSAAQTETH